MKLLLLMLLANIAHAGFDESLSRSLRWKNPTPIARVSDGLLVASVAGTLAYVWVETKDWKKLAYVTAAYLAVYGTTTWIKHEVGRERPNGQDRESHPSGHASAVAVSPGILCVWKGGMPCHIALGAMTVVMYGRIAGGRHFPSDTFSGGAIGFTGGVFVPLVAGEF